MRLIKYLSYSHIDESANKFRAMSISLTTPNEETIKVLTDVYSQYEIEKVEPVLEKLNKELRKVYTGKYSFGLCYESEKKISDIISNKRKIESLTLALFEANDKISKIKSSLETILKK
jgi:predicted transcriptional regulator YdeE